ncbi:LysR family transcriptional regulator [Hoeflea poritis]|uniref:LysR family transcriptional regulator n=1 Tax=Hoeflea poritis TaxID=2993659 RepID=A0ABT4VIA4_9HYPH|nr:LysR family transcriptional regulator [Hoeflea poritis]MDA4844444.1 LysR family transcriptional regulator [Hoeflea poritis]
MIYVNLRQLRFLVAIHEERSFTAAARRVNATQSGLSMQIKELEERLGLRLFDRSSTGVTPTTAGDRLYERATRILREVSAIENDVQTLSGQVSGRVQVGMMPTFARAVLAPVLERFARHYPNVEIKVTEAYSAVLCEAVTNGQLDMAVVPSGKMVPGLKAEHLATDVEVFVTSPNTKRTHLEPVDLSKNKPLKLALPGPGNARREKIDTYLETYQVPIDSIMELDTMMATLDLVSRSDWTTILPGCLCLPDIDDPRRKLHPIVNPPLVVDYVFIEPASQSKTQAAELFADEIVKEIRTTCTFCNSKLGAADAIAG